MPAEPLPDSWDDEPWPLETPASISVHSGRPRHWSDSHNPDDLPEMDVDEVWDVAMDLGVSYEQAEARMMKVRMQQRKWADMFGRDARHTYLTVDHLNQAMRDLWGSGPGNLSTPIDPPVRHTPIPTNDPTIGAIWDEILNRSNPNRLVTPDNPDYGYHARVIPHYELRVDGNRTAHLDIKDIGPT